MTSNEVSKDKKLEVLHDHYKETFARIKEMEAARDRLFLWIIVLFVVLILQITYPMVVGRTIDKLTIFGAELSIKNLPLSALLSVSWVLVLVIGLRYCQSATFIVRQYPYLHHLEYSISHELGDESIYIREGRAYLKDFPAFLNVAWIFYDLFFPLIAMSATSWLTALENKHSGYINVFDTVLSVCLFLLFFIYRIVPALVNPWKRIIN